MTSPIDASMPDTKVHEFMTDLEKWQLQSIENHSFVGTDVYLDGRAFHNCSFQYCHIFIKIGHFRITGSRLIFENNQVMFDGPAFAVKSLCDLLAPQKE